MSDRYDEDNIDDLFRDTLRGAARPPSPPVWDRIESELGKDKRRSRLIWWSAALVAASLILTISGWWLFGLSHYPSQPHIVSGSDAVAITIQRHPPAAISAKPVHMPVAQLPVPIIGNDRHSVLPDPALAENHMEAAGNSPSAVVLPKSRFDLYLPVLPRPVPVIPLPGPDLRIGYLMNNTKTFHSALREPVRLSPTRDKIDITAYLSQELAGYSLADHDSTGPHSREIERRQSTSFSTSVGLLATYAVRRHWAIQSGISLSRSISVGNPGKVVAVKDNSGSISYQINTVTGYGYLTAANTPNIGDSAMTGRITSKLDYISVPLSVSRMWTRNRFTFLAGGGFSTNFLTRATVDASLTGPGVDDQTKEVMQYGLKKISYGILLRGEVWYQVAHFYAISAMATFKNSVGPVNAHTAYSTYPYNLGLGLGLTRLF